MKTLISILVIAVIVGFFTVPSQKKFSNYLVKKDKDKNICPAGIRHESYKVFSFDYVDYCEPTDNTQILRPVFPKPLHTDKYLGLFGTFFKL